MGQYYTPYLKEVNTGKEMTFYSHDWDENGLKLMEHSYIGNYFVGAVVRCLYHNPCKVVWCGDYADEWINSKKRYLNYNKIHESMKDELLSIYEKIMGEDNFDTKHKVKNENIDEEEVYSFCNCKGKIINHTYKVFIDMNKYEAKTRKNDWVPHPLPLLTSIGNGLGGGDYYEEMVNYDKTGLWANSIIEFIDDDEPVPEGYMEVEYEFKERE